MAVNKLDRLKWFYECMKKNNNNNNDNNNCQAESLVNCILATIAFL